MWNVKRKIIPVIIRANWNHLKIFLEISEKHRVKAHQATTENSHSGHNARTLESTDIKVQNIYRGK